MGRDGARGSCGKKALNSQIFVVGYPQLVDRKHLQQHCVELGKELRQWRVHEWYRNTLDDGDVKQSGSSQGDDSDVEGNTLR
jgi:hypothetical protein